MPKTFTAILSAIILLSPVVFAGSSVTLEGVHMCCGACEKGVEKAIATVSGASCDADRDLEEVTISAPNKKALLKSVRAMVDAGYYGTPSDSSVKVKTSSGAKDQVVDSMTIEGLHLCCGKCVSTVNEALVLVKGVTGNTAEKKVARFEVSGRFNERDVFNALNEYGLGGKVAR